RRTRRRSRPSCGTCWCRIRRSRPTRRSGSPWRAKLRLEGRESAKAMSGVSAPRRAVFLDRDGVLNDAIRRNGRPHPPADVGGLRIPAAVPPAVTRLRQAGFLTIAVTNQPDVARGTQTREGVEAINRAIRAQVPLEEILVCYHDDGAGCDCRKPGPGLIIAA